MFLLYFLLTPNALDCFLVSLLHEFNQTSFLLPTPLVTREDLGPLGESVQLAETRLVNLPHLNTRNRSQHLLFLITTAAERQLGSFAHDVGRKLSRL